MLTVLLAVMLLTPNADDTARQSERAAPLIRVLLIVPNSKREPAPASAMQQEVERIWRSAGVHVTWARRLPREEPNVDRVITIRFDDASSSGVELPPGALGGVPRVAGRMRQIIFVSPSAVRQLIGAAGVGPFDVPYAGLYARMVGRVVAHELGHLLLLSSDHRDSGLMRQSFAPPDVRTTEPSQFAVAERDRVLIEDTAAFRRQSMNPAGAMQQGAGRRR